MKSKESVSLPPAHVDHPPPSGGRGQFKRRREEDMIGQSSSTGSGTVVQGGEGGVSQTRIRHDWGPRVWMRSCVRSR